MTEGPMDANSTYLPALDGLRGLAILLVAVSHFAIVFSNDLAAEHAIRTVLSFGWCGVDLFFDLSGFLITGILLETKTSQGYFRDFYMRRILRIFPLYFAFLWFVFLLVPAVIRPNPVAAVNPVWYLAYLQNWKPNYGASDPFLGHFWSLAVEEQFYLVWPAVVFLVSRASLVRVCAVLAFAALLCRLLLASSDADVEAIYRLTPCRVDCLALGSLVAVAVRDGELTRFFSVHLRLILVTSAMCVGAVAAVAGPLWHAPLQHTLGMTALAVFFSALVFSASGAAAGPVRALLTGTLLRSIGKYSYGIYVFHLLPNRLAHQPVKDLLAGSSTPVSILAKTAYVLAMFLAVYLLAFLSYQLFESRLLALKRHFYHRPASPPRIAERLTDPPGNVEGVTL